MLSTLSSTIVFNLLHMSVNMSALNKLISTFLSQAYEERIKAIVQVADELQRENFHESDRIQQRFVQKFCLHFLLGVTI